MAYRCATEAAYRMVRTPRLNYAPGCRRPRRSPSNPNPTKASVAGSGTPKLVILADALPPTQSVQLIYHPNVELALTLNVPLCVSGPALAISSVMTPSTTTPNWSYCGAMSLVVYAQVNVYTIGEWAIVKAMSQGPATPVVAPGQPVAKPGA